ncbi:MAG: TolC family protein [Alphaproteobacteria bacterium]|nr:TolC family protein [Alphaproteobacteria bacterium]
MWSKSYCSQTAIENNYDIKLYKNSVAINKLYYTLGFSGALPTIGLNTLNANIFNAQLNNFEQQTISSSTNASGVFSDNFTPNLNVSYLIFNGYYAKVTYKRYKEILTQSEANLKLQIQNTLALVQEKYFDIIRQINFLKTIESIIDFNQEKLKINVAKKSIGLGYETDILQSQLDLNISVQNKHNQQSIIKQAKIDLCNLMAMPPDTSFILTDTNIFTDAIVLDSILNRLVESPQLQSLASQIKITELTSKQINSLAYPKVGISTGLSLNYSESKAGFIRNSQTYGPYVGLTLSVPIYNGGVAKQQLKINKFNIDNDKLNYRKQLDLAITNVQKLYLDYLNFSHQIQVEKDNIILSENLLNKQLGKYKLGAVTILDIEQAQQNLEQAYYRLINIQFLAAYAATELLKLQGGLSIQ